MKQKETHGASGPRQHALSGEPDVILSDRRFQCYFTKKKQLGKLRGGEFYQRQVLFDE